MHYKFDSSKISVEYVWLKQVVESIDSSMLVVDTEASTAKESTVLKRYPLAQRTANMFKKMYSIKKYIVPVPAVVVKYDDNIISLERSYVNITENIVYHKPTDSPVFKSNSEKNVAIMLAEVIDDNDWYIDGQFVYKFDGDIENAIWDGDELSSNGKFNVVHVETFKLSTLCLSSECTPELQTRTCMGYITDSMEYSLTSPLWKDLNSLGEKQSVDVITGINRFDKLDQFLGINLNFALRAARIVGDIFGYDEISPIQLPELMIHLNTVNLPKIPKEIRATFDVGMKPTEAFAWLLGLLGKTTSYEDYITIGGLLKYLTQRGLFYKESFSSNKIFNLNMENTAIPLVDVNIKRKKILTELEEEGRIEAEMMKNRKLLTDEG